MNLFIKQILLVSNALKVTGIHITDPNGLRHALLSVMSLIRAKLREDKHAVLFMFIRQQGTYSAWLGSQEVWG